MSKLIFDKIPVIKAEDAHGTKPNYCDLPALRKYRSVLKSGYSLKEDIRGKVIGNLYLDRVIAVSGVFGVVMRGYDVLDGKFYAVKIIIPEISSSDDIKSEMEAFKILSKYPQCDEDIVCLYKSGFYKGSGKLSKKVQEAFRKAPYTKDTKLVKAKGNYGYFQTELMSADLNDFINQMAEYHGKDWGQKYPEIVERVMLDILGGMYTIHKAGLAHMDLKPENVLVRFRNGIEGCEFYENPRAEDVDTKVSDLGFICSGEKERGKLKRCWSITNPAYTSPETAKNWMWDKYPIELAQKSDIWALGLILGDLMFEEKFMKQIRIANATYVEDIEHLTEIKDDLTEEEIEKMKKGFREDFEEDYYSFVGDVPDYNSGNDEFDRNLSLIFYNMIDIKSDLRSDVGKIIEEFPES